MKEKQNKRWGLKILSLMCAFLVWLGVVNVADPITTNSVEVPVEIENEDVLTQNNLTYEIVGKKTTTITYDVKTTNAYRIHASDFRAYADMKDLWSVTGSIPVKVEVLSHSEFLSSAPVSRTSTIKIQTEPLQKKRFDLTTQITGELEDGYEVGEIVLTPAFLYAEGPESLIGQISSVGVEIPADGVTADMTGTLKPQYYDANGNKITLSDRVDSDCEAVSYQMTVLKVKSLSLDFQVSGTVAPGYRFTGIECDVKTVPVMGLKSVLASLHTITVPSEVLNISGARSNVVRTVNLEDYLPENVTIAGMKTHEVQVTLNVEKLEERSYTLQTDKIALTGKKNELIYSPEQETVTVRVRGLKEELDNLTVQEDLVTCNVAEMTEGKHSAKLALALDDAFEIMSVSACDINVTKVPESGDASTEATEKTSEAAGTTAAQSTQVSATVGQTQEENPTVEESSSASVAGETQPETKAAAETAGKTDG